MGRTSYFDARAGDLQGLSLALFYTSINISLKDKYLYCPTPKVACSSILMTLQRFQARDPNLIHDPLYEIHNRSFSPLLNPLQVPSFEAVNNGGDFFRFCFARNPFDRIISAYLNKVVVEKSLVPRLASALNRSDEQFTFEDFLDVISTENVAEMDLHYAPQSRVTFQGFVNYDFIGKYENLQSDLERVYETIGCDTAKFGVVVNPHYTGEKDYAKYLTPGNCEIIKKMYQEDFERFQYREIPPQ